MSAFNSLKYFCLHLCVPSQINPKITIQVNVVHIGGKRNMGEEGETESQEGGQPKVVCYPFS